MKTTNHKLFYTQKLNIFNNASLKHQIKLPIGSETNRDYSCKNKQKLQIMKTGSWGENYTNIIRFNTIESELNSYLCSKLDEQREKILQIANDKANDVGINGMVISDLLYTSVCNIENTFRSNLDNLLAIFCNNTHSGYLYFYDLMFMSKVCKDENKSKKQAFAFICEKNLKEEFKLFCNNEGSEY